MCYDDNDGEPCELFDERVVARARKTHRCSECHEPIAVGDSYLRTFGVWGGDASRFKTCARCYFAREVLADAHEARAEARRASLLAALESRVSSETAGAIGGVALTWSPTAARQRILAETSCDEPRAPIGLLADSWGEEIRQGLIPGAPASLWDVPRW